MRRCPKKLACLGHGASTARSETSLNHSNSVLLSFKSPENHHRLALDIGDAVFHQLGMNEEAGAQTPISLVAGITIALFVISYLAYQAYFVDATEAPIPYEVTVPDYCKPRYRLDTSTLQNPSIHVGGPREDHVPHPKYECLTTFQLEGSTLIQCICPANGKLLGHVNPYTPDAIDRAIAKAKHAQIAWARTTFAQRRRLLRTLLRLLVSHVRNVRQ